MIDFSTTVPKTPPYRGIRILQDWTYGHDKLYAALDQVMQAGATPLFDALLDTLDFTKASALPNSAVLCLSDGEENSSTYATYTDVERAAVGADIPIFGVGLGNAVDFGMFQRLAIASGGTFASVNDPAGLAELFRKLGLAVKNGRVIVSASITFDDPLPENGAYTISGTLNTTIHGLTRSDDFSFQVIIGQAKVAHARAAPE